VKLCSVLISDQSEQHDAGGNGESDRLNLIHLTNDAEKMIRNGTKSSARKP
jgi:hypothetical protein